MGTPLQTDTFAMYLRWPDRFKFSTWFCSSSSRFFEDFLYLKDSSKQFLNSLLLI